jgi:hypothetical protein
MMGTVFFRAVKSSFTSQKSQVLYDRNIDLSSYIVTLVHVTILRAKGALAKCQYCRGPGKIGIREVSVA